MKNVTFSQENDAELVQDFLHEVSDTDRFVTRVDFEHLHISPPIDCYTITLDEILKGKTIGNAIRRATRYYLLSQEQAVAEIDVVTHDGSRRVLSLQQDAIAARGAMRGLNIAADTYPDGQYEVRLLIVHDVLFIGIWLHGNDDLVIPIEPAAMKTYEFHSAEALFECLKTRS
ncbi:TPA: hypothetical protein ACQVH3_005046 [Serratia marcescens]